MNLLDLKRKEFDRSEFWQYCNLGGGLLIYLIGLTAVLFDLSPKWTRVLAVVTVVIQFFSLYLRHRSAIHFDLADEIRRRNDLAHGLGIQPSAEEIEDWHFRVGKVTSEGVDNERYFSTDTDTPGPRKLMESLKGSAFFTSNIAGRAAMVYGAIAVGGYLVAVFTLIIFVQADVSSANLGIVSQAVIASMVFWAAGELAWFALCYYRLNQTAKRIRDRCAEALRQAGEPDLTEAMVIVGEYNCAAAQCPPLPGLVYKILQGPLNEAQEIAKKSLSESKRII
jgi:hypothetical protein